MNLHQLDNMVQAIVSSQFNACYQWSRDGVSARFPYSEVPIAEVFFLRIITEDKDQLINEVIQAITKTDYTKREVYWRIPPALVVEKNFATNKTIYFVEARGLLL